MGIPSYFAWLCRHFDDEIVTQECPFPVIHNFYLDFNGAIHPAARSRSESSFEEMCQGIIIYLEHLIDAVQPTQRLFIAIDGVAPTAKMRQQHTRRFKAIRETTELNALKRQYQQPLNESKQKDFNSISPATVFMSQISDAVEQFLKTHHNGKYKHLDIIFSNASLPSEGEHKILKAIKEREAQIDPKTGSEEVSAIYGLDSDLIMLALSTDLPRIILVRENNLMKNNNLDLDINKFPQMCYFSIANLYQRLVSVMNPYTSLQELEGLKIFSLDRQADKTDPGEFTLLMNSLTESKFFSTTQEMSYVIKDYIFISFLLGNDFVPACEALKIREGGIEVMLRAYKKVIQTRGDYLLTPKYEINPGFFLDLITILASQEEQLLKKQKMARDRRIKSRHPNDVPRNYGEAVEAYQIVDGLYQDTINVFAPGWQYRYYDLFFDPKTTIEANRQAQIQQICEDYLRALHWIARYYFVDCPDWHWSYPHEANPLLGDLMIYLQVNKDKINEIEFTEYEPVHPYHQLLMILPPQSAALLPEPFRYIMTSDDSPLIHYYPTDFKFNYYGKRYKWECHPRVPCIHPRELDQYLKPIHAKLSEVDRQRGEVGQLLIFNKNMHNWK